MIPLFLALTGVNLICLSLATALGYLATAGRDVRALHTLAGALGAIVCCGVHCVVFTYFIATAKWIRHAVAVKRLDGSLIEPTRSFKAQAFPAALLGIGSVFAAAVLGAARDNAMMERGPHGWLALAALLVNVIVAFVEYRAITRNGQLVDSVLAAIARQDQASATARTAEADVV